MLQQKKGNNEIIQIILDMTIKKSILIFFLLYLFYEGAANTLIWQIFFFIDDLPDASFKGSVLLY